MCNANNFFYILARTAVAILCAMFLFQERSHCDDVDSVIEKMTDNDNKFNNIVIYYSQQSKSKESSGGNQLPRPPLHQCFMVFRGNDITSYRDIISNSDKEIKSCNAMKWSNIGRKVKIIYYFNEKNMTKNMIMVSPGDGDSINARLCLLLSLGVGYSSRLTGEHKVTVAQNGFVLKSGFSFWEEDKGSITAFVDTNGLVRKAEIESNVNGNLHTHTIVTEGMIASQGTHIAQSGKYKLLWNGVTIDGKIEGKPILKEDNEYSYKDMKTQLDDSTYNKLVDMSTPNDSFIIDRVENRRKLVNTKGRVILDSPINKEPLIKSWSGSDIFPMVVFHGIAFVFIVAILFFIRRKSLNRKTVGSAS